MKRKLKSLVSLSCVCRRLCKTVCSITICQRWAPTTSSWCDDICQSAGPSRRRSVCLLKCHQSMVYFTWQQQNAGLVKITTCDYRCSSWRWVYWQIRL